ncbi:MAG: hypothetical protein ACJ757_16935 [Gaiellaceae bacterium]
MSPRFITNLIVLFAGGVVVVSSRWFGAGTTGWIAFGVAVGILGLTAAAQRDRMRGTVQGALDGVVLSLAAWSAVASVVFRGSALTWLSFADALAFAALATGGLIAHELSTERVVHSLAPARSDSSMKAAA